jgi:hypothetical protein
MYRILIILLVGIIPFTLNGQTQLENSSHISSDSITMQPFTTNLNGQIEKKVPQHISFNSSTIQTDTLRSFLVRKNPPYLFNSNLNHHERKFGNKMLRGCLYSAGYNATILTILVFSPTWLSRWENEPSEYKIEDFKQQYKKSYTTPPVVDEDLFMTNYVGHPYQGAFYYNSVRSQGAKVWQSALFCLGQSLFWEYGLEAGFEQPSIQDLIVTPVAGSIFGELSHVATIAMSKHGFRWYEIATVCVINPSYAINNGFRFNKSLKIRMY